ncbi:FAD-binding oxidoreductase [Mesobacillus maritimus]|uniref:FAD-binding oxidoreductase n=1 Tax=Mesobacillus maritimus TaxID=1643336 RepID=UPI00203D87FA|nr:FAD-binding oxidoreductase [Mesobacillus maritimus]
MVTTELLGEMKTFLPNLKVETSDQQVTVYPQTESEISEVLKYCNENKRKVQVLGGGTKSSLGFPNETVDLKLCLSEYTGIVEHTVGDMTVTVKAGTRYEELQEYLAQHNQRVALDPSWPEHATIGGVIAANDSGPKRLGYGTARDSVIGIRTVYPDGRIIRSGGRVVKNVAGYDMNKLFIGSMGTLGVISEITLKLRPVQKSESLLILSFPSGNLEEVRSFAIKLLDSMMEPVSLELFNPGISARLLDKNVYTLAISLEDVESSVRYQEELIQKLCPTEAELEIVSEEGAKQFWKKVYTTLPNGNDSKQKDADSEKAVSMKIGVVNLDVVKVIRESQLLSDGQAVTVEAHGGLGTGICQVMIRGSKEDVVQTITRLREYAKNLNGYGIVRYLPGSLAETVDIWGDKPSYYPLLEGIKAKMDPNRIMNPNRFVGGI